MNERPIIGVLTQVCLCAFARGVGSRAECALLQLAHTALHSYYCCSRATPPPRATRISQPPTSSG